MQFKLFIKKNQSIKQKSLTEVRQEAVQQALAALKNRPKPSLPMPSKRSSVLNRSPEREREDSGKLFKTTQTIFYYLNYIYYKNSCFLIMISTSFLLLPIQNLIYNIQFLMFKCIKNVCVFLKWSFNGRFLGTFLKNFDFEPKNSL